MFPPHNGPARGAAHPSSIGAWFAGVLGLGLTVVAVAVLLADRDPTAGPAPGVTPVPPPPGFTLRAVAVRAPTPFTDDLEATAAPDLSGRPLASVRLAREGGRLVYRIRATEGGDELT